MLKNIRTIFAKGSQKWAAWSYKGATIVLLVVLIIIFIFLIALRTGEESPEEKAVLPQVQVQSLDDASEGSTIQRAAAVRSVNTAPLVARTGGRVTSFSANLGDDVRAGQLVITIDGGVEANPAEAGVEGAAATLAIFNRIERQGLAAAANAVTIAELNLKAASTTGQLGVDAQTKARELADSALQQAQLAQDQALEANQDFLIRSANIGLQAAELAQDQATIARQLSATQRTNAVAQATAGLESARIAQANTAAQLETQRTGLTTQLVVAREQYRQTQVAAPISGTITTMSVRAGDYVQPGRVVGEIASPGSSLLSIDIPQGAGIGLRVGQNISVTINGQSEQGVVTRLGRTSNSSTGLIQVDITISKSVSANAQAIVHIPVSSRSSNGNLFIPLDAVNVRERGLLVLIVEGDVIHEYTIKPIRYYEGFVEASADLPVDAKIVVHGNRTLREGDTVTVSDGSL